MRGRPISFQRRRGLPLASKSDVSPVAAPKKKILSPKELSKEMLISWARLQIKAIDDWYRSNGQFYDGPVFEKEA